MSRPATAMAEEPQTPNTGRIVDYWLGGRHHYPVDVAGARQFEAVYDGFPKVFKELRAYIGRVSRYIESAGIRQFIVLGAGLPTCGNVHEAVPDSNVLYTDIDEDNIRLGQKILSLNPKVSYAYCDATDMSTLAPSELVDPNRPVGLVLVGATAFMADDVLRTAMHRLYEWAPSGSLMALDFDGEALSHHPEALKLLTAIGAELHMRDPAAIECMLSPWELREPGILPAYLWPDGKGKPTPADQVFMYGCVVGKSERR